MALVLAGQGTIEAWFGVVWVLMCGICVSGNFTMEIRMALHVDINVVMLVELAVA